ncbi:type IV secretion system protein TraC [Vibrio sp. S11_S32]|uniref:type IV secretion system protein TraC n=1 Tax=Vibrio sp. S11_S32 TaxID=2720225 RepID=UPI00167FE39A|nr:type IV secretion system protein TraC [Vibrio sp. S11_S32]MBD1576951.1 type IV secretion system protein TraC [Vibrio sp. S11_S32]
MLKRLTESFKPLHDFYKQIQSQSNAPSLTDWLPYREYDADDELYFNTRSVGFAKIIEPLAGANDELVESLNKFLCKLPDGEEWDYQFVMLGTHQVDDYLELNRKAASVRGGINAALAQKEYAFSRYSACYGFPTKKNNTYRLDLKNYRCALFVSRAGCEVEELKLMKEVLETELIQSNIFNQNMTPAEFITHLSQTLNFNHKDTRLTVRDYNRHEPINEQVLASHSRYLTTPEAIHYQTTIGEEDHDGVVVNFTLSKLPSEFRLYAFPEVLASLTDSAKSLKCPFRISCNVHIHEKTSAKEKNDRKLKTAEKWASSPMGRLMPKVGEEIAERKHLAQGFDNDSCKLSGMVFTLTLFTTKELMNQDITSARKTFEAAGLDITPVRHLQMQALLATLPFFLPNGMFQDMKKLGRIRTIKTSNIVNFLPIVTGRRDLNVGLLLPTMRNQINYFDPFTCGSDNYNIAVMAGSGAGKSFFMQNLAKSIFERFGRIWILDKGDSYKKLTQVFGGVYMSSKDIALNPFTHLKQLEEKSHSDREARENPLKVAINDITGLIAAMAAPNSELADYQLRAISLAITKAYEKKGHLALIDDVRDALNEIAEEQEKDRRILDLAFQLGIYCTDGLYGDIFNKPSQLDPNVDFTTLELDGFNDELLQPVVFALMVNINQAMYLSGDRSTPKMCIIEEAWKLMSGGNKQSKAFIENGYRTARKFGGSFAAVTQGVQDFFSSDEAMVAYNNSDIKFLLRQGDGFDAFLNENPNVFSPFELKMIKSFEPAAKVGYSSVMIKAGGQISFHRLFANAWSRMLFSTEPKEFEFVEKLITEGLSEEDAVTKGAWHFFPDEMTLFEKMEAQCNE